MSINQALEEYKAAFEIYTQKLNARLEAIEKMITHLNVSPKAHQKLILSSKNQFQLLKTSFNEIQNLRNRKMIIQLNIDYHKVLLINQNFTLAKIEKYSRDITLEHEEIIQELNNILLKKPAHIDSSEEKALNDTIKEVSLLNVMNEAIMRERQAFFDLDSQFQSLYAAFNAHNSLKIAASITLGFDSSTSQEARDIHSLPATRTRSQSF